MSGLGIPRRRFLAGSLATAAMASPFGIVRGAPVTFDADPYTLGVASGCPREDSVILWTRLAPRPLEEGGMPSAPVEVEWQVAEDEGFARIAAKGVERAIAELAHSVHAEAKGLQPGRVYWYRFRAGTAVSPVGRYPHRAGRGQQPVLFRLRLLPAIRAGLLRRVPRYGYARPRSGRASRRLHL